MVIFYQKWKKYNEIQLTKRKMDKSFTLPRHIARIMMRSQINVSALNMPSASLKGANIKEQHKYFAHNNVLTFFLRLSRRSFEIKFLKIIHASK